MAIQHGRRALLASAARTATTTSAALRNRRHRAVQLVLDVTAASGTGGLTLKIQQVDRATTKTLDLLVDGAAITATGTFGFQLALGVGAAGNGIRVAVARALPTDWQVTITHGDASSYTYSLNATLLE